MEKRKIKWDSSILYIALLVVYSLLLVNQGLTTTDTGYNYGNFIHFDTLDVMWKFSTYLATAIGAFFTNLPWGDTMLGLNIYTGLVKAAIAVLVYLVCVKFFGMKKWLAFAAEIVALGYCWCPTALLYNYVTYLLFNLGAILLCMAVHKKKSVLYIMAGICLGLNVMVRLPNLAEAALILALWFYCFITREKFSETVKRTGLCLAGYLGSILVVIAYISIKYGFDSYVEGITQILAMSETATSYSLKTMIRGDVLSCIQNAKWLFMTIGLSLGGVILYAFMQKRFIWVKRIAYVICNLLLIHVFRMLHMFGYIYHDYQGIFFVGIFIQLIAGAVGLYVMFFGGKNYQLRMWAITMGIIILITPLGSNNYLFTAVNNLFLAIPFLFQVAYILAVQGQPGLEHLKEKFEKFTIVKKIGPRLFVEPITITLVVMLAFISMQGFLFGCTFVFRDGIYGEKRTAVVTENRVIAGMYTGEENGKAIQEINDYLNKEKLKGQKALLYYNVPAFSFYMDLQPAISSTWPDLDSFTIDKFEQELDNLKKQYAETGEKPLVILGCTLDLEHPKMDLLRAYVEELDYLLTFDNGKFFIYQ